MTSSGAERDTFPMLLARHAERSGDKVVIREKRRGLWQSMTWGQLAVEAGALANSLAGRGIGRGDRVALIGENRPGLFVAMAAAHRLGAVVVPLFPDASASEVCAQIIACEAKMVFAENQEQVDKTLRILPRCPSVRLVAYDDDRGMRHYSQASLFASRDLVDAGRAVPGRPGHVATADDPAFVFFTSATSGEAKGAVFSHRALIEHARRVIASDGLTSADVTLAFLAPGWMCQTLFTYVLAMVAGHCICCPESSDTLLEDLREIAPTTLLVTPRMLDAILSQVSFRIEDSGGVSRALYRRAIANAERIEARRLGGEEPGLGDRIAAGAYDLLIGGPLRDSLGMSRVRAAYSTGDSLDPGVLTRFRALGVDLRQLYGTTETAFAVAMHRAGAVRPDTVGPLLDGVEAMISPEGEILVRSARAPSGYVGASGTAGDWIPTGDLGRLDEAGHLRVEGRKDSVGRLATGKLFAPRALESRIRVSPYVREAVVIGDGRDQACALIDIDALAVGKWADGHEIPYMGHVDLASQEKVYGLIAEWISEVNETLAADPSTAQLQVARFVLLPNELSAEDGLLTRTGKLRRAAISARFAGLIDALYAGETEAMLDVAEVSGHDAPDAAGGLKIRDARVVGGAAPRRAA